MTTRGFDEADRYEAWFTSPLGAFVDRLETGALERALAGLAPGTPVVDVGAGTGHFARPLADRHPIVAVEPAPAMLAEGRRRTGDLPIRWCAGVGERLPLAARSAGAVVLMTSLEWVDGPGRCVDEARRVLRPGGRLVVGHLSPLSPWAARYRRRADEGADPWVRATFFTRADLVELVGAEPARVEGVVHLAPDATRPWPAADAAGRRAGNHPALEVLQWTLTT